MADYTLPALTAADINGIVTAGQDGTYDITYTNLTSNQIQMIGQAFEQAMSDTLANVALTGNYDDINGAPQLPESAWETVEHAADEEHEETWTSQELKGFSNIAFSGDYTDLNPNSKPSATNLQSFHPIAFSGDYTDLNPNSKPSATNLQSFHPIAFSGDYTDLNNIPNLSAIAFNADYRNLQNAPEIPDSAYLETTIINGTEVGTAPLGFHIIAFSGDYNDIENKINYVIQLNTYNNSLVQTLASEDCIINDSNMILLNNKSIEEVLILAAEDFIQRSALIYIQNNYFKTLITTVRKTNDFYEIGLAPIITSNYNALKEQENIDLDTLNSVVGTSVLIIDINKHRILCKYNNF